MRNWARELGVPFSIMGSPISTERMRGGERLGEKRKEKEERKRGKEKRKGKEEMKRGNEKRK